MPVVPPFLADVLACTSHSFHIHFTFIAHSLRWSAHKWEQDCIIVRASAFAVVLGDFGRPTLGGGPSCTGRTHAAIVTAHAPQTNWETNQVTPVFVNETQSNVFIKSRTSIKTPNQQVSGVREKVSLSQVFSVRTTRCAREPPARTMHFVPDRLGEHK